MDRRELRAVIVAIALTVAVLIGIWVAPGPPLSDTHAIERIWAWLKEAF